MTRKMPNGHARPRAGSDGQGETAKTKPWMQRVALKYQIFVSSTFTDLVEERQDAIRNILDLGHIPAGMELFPASDIEQLSYIKKIIDECDYYVIIVGGRYGSLDEEGVSYTEREYDYAVSTGKVVLAFIHGEPGAISVAKTDVAPRLAAALAEFRAKVATGRIVKFWNSRAQLEALLLKGMVRAFADQPALGWVRGGATSNEELLEQINNLRVENDELREKYKDMKKKISPAIEGLAGMEEIFELHYKTKTYMNRMTVNGKGSLPLPWREIFIALAPAVSKPVVPLLMKIEIRDYIKSNHDTNISELEDVSFQVVKAQMTALGLVGAFNAEAVNGGVQEWVQLTELGKATLLESLTVKVGGPMR